MISVAKSDEKCFFFSELKKLHKKVHIPNIVVLQLKLNLFAEILVR